MPVLESLNPKAVINCAAYNHVDLAEEEEQLATEVNGVAVGVIAGWGAERGRPILTYSTDYVFQGDASRPYVESSPTTPGNAYGRSKLLGERRAREAGALVVRTSWVVSGTHTSFVSRMIELSEKQALNVVDDQFGCPTVAGDLAAASLDALDRGVKGLLHLTNEGETTWFELARTAVELAGGDVSAVAPCRTEDYPTPARRPGYSVLGSERREELGLLPMPKWQESLPHLVSEIKTWL